MARKLQFLTDPINGLMQWAGSAVTTLNQHMAETNSVPTGSQVNWHSATPPTDWLLCDGSSVLVADQPTLFSVIGYTYGGAGANFSLPPAPGSGFTIIRA